MSWSLLYTDTAGQKKDTHSYNIVTIDMGLIWESKTDPKNSASLLKQHYILEEG